MAADPYAPWISVAMIRTGHILCTTMNTAKAAHALIPGTQYERGYTNKQAESLVVEACKALRDGRY